jgi:peptidoglycan/xylan/chitin deacetylase (PgdA/CDA1 family)
VSPTRLIEIRGVDLAEESAHLRGRSIDRPRLADRAEADSLEIAGWVLGRDARAVAVQVLDDEGKIFASFLPEIPRWDVGSAFPGVASAEVCGFRGQIRVAPGTEPLRLQAILEGGACVDLGILRFRFLEEREEDQTGGVILVYHRVAEIESDPWGLAVAPVRFAEQMEVLRREFRPVALRRLLELLDTGNPPSRTVAVTFDDGYADNLERALPALELAEVPATVFFASGYVGGSREFWWDELERILLGPGPLPSVLELGPDARWRLDDPPLDDSEKVVERKQQTHRVWRAWEEPPTRRHSLYRDLWKRWHGLPEKERSRESERLREWAGRRPDVRPSHRALSEGEARQLAASELIDVGAHTVSHPVLSTLPADSQRREIFDSAAHLSALLDRPVRTFAYPFGTPADYDSATVALVRGAGYAGACSNFPGLARAETDRFQLPRVPAPDCDGDELAFRLRTWFRG